MRGTKSSGWKPILAACLIALLLVPAVASAHMEWADEPTGYYADMPAIALPQHASAVHELRTVKVAGADNTLALALSAAALGIALGGAAYVVLRLSPRTARSRQPTAEA